MSTRKNKVHVAFRIEAETIEKIDKTASENPDIFRSKAEIVDASLWHFVSLSKTQQKEILKKYLTKDL